MLNLRTHAIEVKFIIFRLSNVVFFPVNDENIRLSC